MKYFKSKSKKAFTLIEIVFSVTLLLIITGISIPIYQSFQFRNELDVGLNLGARALKSAQIYAQASDGDSTWGVHFARDKITLFKGLNFATRDVDYDQIYNISNIITPSGLSEVVFAKFTGDPLNIGNIILTNNYNEQKTITVNSKGTINY